MLQTILRMLPTVGLFLTPCNNIALADAKTLAEAKENAHAGWQAIRSEYGSGIKYSRLCNDIRLSKGKISSEKVIETEISRLNSYSKFQTAYIKSDDPEDFPVAEDEFIRLKNFSTEPIRLLTFVNNRYYGRLTNSDTKKLLDYQPNTINMEVVEVLDYTSMPALRFDDKNFIDKSIIGFSDFVPPNGKGSYIVTDAVKVIGDNGRKLIKLQLDFAMPGDEGMFDVSTGAFQGFLILDPSRNWCLVEYYGQRSGRKDGQEYLRNLTQEISIKATHDVQTNSFHPKNIVTSISMNNNPISSKREVFEEIEPCKFNTADCYFSAYGLPEPRGEGTAFRRIMIGLLSMVAVMLTVIVMRRRLISSKI